MFSPAFIVLAAMLASGDPAAADDRVICKTEARTNTRFPSKTCRTKKEWDTIREANRQTAKEIIDRPLINRSDNN